MEEGAQEGDIKFIQQQEDADAEDDDAETEAAVAAALGWGVLISHDNTSCFGKSIFRGGAGLLVFGERDG